MQSFKSTHTNFLLVTDQMNNLVRIPQNPSRIISLVPSQTELLFYLGLSDKVVGITKFCIHPKAEVKGKTLVGGTKNFNFDTIHQLQPDLIIGNKEENYPEGIKMLRQHYPVWMSDINTLTDAWEMIGRVAALTGTQDKAKDLLNAITLGFDNLSASISVNTAYFIWRNPYMAVGSNTFIHAIMTKAGFNNVFSPLHRYPVITPEELKKAKPQMILLSSEPYPFREKHINEIKLLCPSAIVKLVDGEMFSWYGSRLQHTPAYLQSLQQLILSEMGNHN